MKTRPPCVDWREKLALRHEDLSPIDQRALDAHVQTCEACATALADYHFFEARLDALPPPAIKPLPRLSPQFFERAEREHSSHKETSKSIPREPMRSANKAGRQPNKATRIVRRVFSIAAVLCLLLSAGAIFRVISTARLASHPSGDTLFNFNQHTDLVSAVAWSPDGQSIATASYDHTVKVWNALNGNLVCTYTGNNDIVNAVAWSPNSQLIASGGNDNTVRIWNAANCNPTTSYATHTESGAIASIAWSPDGQYIASGGWDYMAQIWNISTGKIAFTIPFTDAVSSVAWSPNGQEIAVGSWDKTVQIWNTQIEKPLHTYSNYSDAVDAVAWSPNGRYLAIGDHNGTVEVRDVSNGKIICDYTQHTNSVNAVAWSPDGQYIASGSDDKTVRVWNPFSPGTPTIMVYTQHTDNVSSVAWSPNGKEIVSGSWDDTAKVWTVI